MAWLQVLALELAHAPSTIVMVLEKERRGREQFVMSTTPPDDVVGVVAPLTRSTDEGRGPGKGGGSPSSFDQGFMHGLPVRHGPLRLPDMALHL